MTRPGHGRPSSAPTTSSSRSSACNFPLGIDIHYPVDANRRYFEVADWDILASDAWKFRDRKSYGAHVYSKTALTLATLERLLGTPAMDRALRLYADRWRFRHPTTRDFIAAVNDSTGQDWRWFFDRTFFSSGDRGLRRGGRRERAGQAPARTLRKGRQALARAPPADLPKARGYDSQRDRRAARGRRDAGGGRAALRGRPRAPGALGRRGPVEAVPRRARARASSKRSWIPGRRSCSTSTARTTAGARRTIRAPRPAGPPAPVFWIQNMIDFMTVLW